MGLPLFEQLGKKIFLTEAGQRFLPYSRGIAHQLAEADEIMAELRGGRQGHLSLAIASTAKYFVPGLLGIFHRRFPGMRVGLDVTNRETLLNRLEQNDVDLVIMGQPPEGLDVEAGIISDNPLVVIAAADHPLARERNIDPARLSREPFLIREPGSGSRSAAERFFAARDIALNVEMEIASNEAIKQSVAAGLGLALLSRVTLASELKTGRLTILDVAGLPIMRQWHVVHRRGKRLGLVAQAFRQFLLDEAAGLLG